MNTGEPLGPFYLRKSDRSIREGLWYETEPPEVNESLSAEFRFDRPHRPPRAREGYCLIEPSSRQHETFPSWTPVYPLGNEDPKEAGCYLVDPRRVDPVRLLSLTGGSRRIFLDLRGCPWPLSALHTMPVHGWLQRQHLRPPSYQPEEEPEGRVGRDPILWMQHGFTGDPKSWQHMHRHLNRAPWGYISPLLPGHGLAPEQFEQYGMEDWTRFISTVGDWLDAFQHDTIGIGLSMGGALLVHHWEYFRGLVLINVPYHVPDWRRHFLPLISLFRRFYVPGDAESKIPVRSLLDLRRLLDENREVYPEVDCPVLVVNHKNDTTVPPGHGEQLAGRLPDVERVLLDRGGHESTEDPEVVPRLLRLIGDWAEQRDLGLPNFTAQTVDKG